jgi:iron complex outermembrane receptor protein
VIKGPAATMYGGGVGAVRFYTRPDFTKGLLFQKMQVGAFKTFQSRTQLNVADENYSVMRLMDTLKQTDTDRMEAV